MRKLSVVVVNTTSV